MIKALDNAVETTGQGGNRFFGLFADNVDMVAPTRHSAINHCLQAVQKRGGLPQLLQLLAQRLHLCVGLYLLPLPVLPL